MVYLSTFRAITARKADIIEGQGIEKMLTFNKIGPEDLLSSKEAAALSGYASDYVDQLCRENKVECRMIDGIWHISKQSLLSYKKNNDHTDTSLPMNDGTGRIKIPASHVPAEDTKKPNFKKEIRLVKMPLVEEHFSGKKLARLHQAIQEGSLKASKVLQGSVANMPARDFWHKALSMMTAVLLVFGSYYVFQSGVIDSGVNSISRVAQRTAGAVANFSNTDLVIKTFGQGTAGFSRATASHLSSLGDKLGQNIVLSSITVRIAAGELVQEPFGFLWRAARQLASNTGRMISDIQLANAFVERMTAGTAAAGLWRW